MSDNCSILFCIGIQNRVKQLFKLTRADAQNGSLVVDEAFLDHIHRHVQGSQTRAFADTALEHPEFAFLNCELDILHILEVALEPLTDVVKFLVDIRHCYFQRLQVLVVSILCSFIQRVGGADTGNHVFTLGVDEPFTVEVVVSGCGVA